MGEETVEIGSPLVVEDVVIRPIARRRLDTVEGEHGHGILARLQPVGVLVEEDGRSRTLDLDGEEISDEVLADLPQVGGEEP